MGKDLEKEKATQRLMGPLFVYGIRASGVAMPLREVFSNLLGLPFCHQKNLKEVCSDESEGDF